MNRRSPVLLISFAMAFILAACQGATPTTRPGGAPTATAGTGQPAPTATAGSGSAQTPAPGGGGGGGGGGGLTLPEGAWSGGNLHLVVSGDFSATIDAPLFPSTSVTIPDYTILYYIAEASQSSVTLGIYSDYVAISLTTPQFVGGAGSTQDSVCSASFARREANSVEGTITCTDAPVVSTAGAIGQTVDMQGSFTATR
jgi:hypothetical protein